MDADKHSSPSFLTPSSRYVENQPTIRLNLSGWHEHRFKIVSTPATDEDFEQDKGAHKRFTLDRGIGENWPFYFPRYQVGEVYPGYFSSNSEGKRRTGTGVPPDPRFRHYAEGLKERSKEREMKVALFGRCFLNFDRYDPPRYTSGYHRAMKNEKDLVEGAVKWFDGRFVDLGIDREDDLEFFDAIEEVTRWIQEGKCEELERFVNAQNPKPSKRKKRGVTHDADEDQDEDEGEDEDEDEVAVATDLLIGALDAVGHKFLERLDSCKKTSSTDQNGRSRLIDPHVAKRFVSFCKPIDTAARRSLGRGLKRKGKSRGFWDK